MVYFLYHHGQDPVIVHFMALSGLEAFPLLPWVHGYQLELRFKNTEMTSVSAHSIGFFLLIHFSPLDSQGHLSYFAMIGN